MARKDYISILILVGVQIFGVFGICPHHCLKKLEAASCRKLSTAASSYNELTSMNWDSNSFFNQNSGNMDRIPIPTPDYSDPSPTPDYSDPSPLPDYPDPSPPPDYSDPSPPPDYSDPSPLPDYPDPSPPPDYSDPSPPPDYSDPSPPPDYSDPSPPSGEQDYDHTRLRPSPGKPEEVINGLDINFNCRISDQGKLHFRFKLDDDHEHKCLSCFCYKNEQEGAEPGCNIVDKTKCYEMGLQIRPKIKRKQFKSRTKATGTRLWPFEQIARLHQLQRLTGQRIY